MRAGGGRTKSRGSLRGDRKVAESAGPTCSLKEPWVEQNRSRLRSGSSAAKPLSAARPRRRKHLEAFIPEQRHMFGEERLFLPCPGSPR
jgi:hypothetical protein